MQGFARSNTAACYGYDFVYYSSIEALIMFSPLLPSLQLRLTRQGTMYLRDRQRQKHQIGLAAGPTYSVSPTFQHTDNLHLGGAKFPYQSSIRYRISKNFPSITTDLPPIASASPSHSL